jgi:hypothetical protein
MGGHLDRVVRRLPANRAAPSHTRGALFSFADDQIKEFHQYFDSMALYEQLGLTAQ